jgi:F0F1-type ATP synthase delta subunit
MKQAYIKALIKTILTGTPVETALANTKVVLEKKGHQKLWGVVLKGLVRELEYALALSTPKIFLAKDDAQALEKAKAAAKAISGSDESEVVIDESLIGGYIARTKDIQVDSSYKRALLDVYRKVTK